MADYSRGDLAGINPGDDWVNLPPEKIGSHLYDKVQKYYNFLSSSNYMALLKVAYFYYFDQFYDGGQTFRIGANGEFTSINCNQYRNLIDTQYSIITQQRQEVECMAVNNDFESLADVKIGNKLITYYEKQKEMGRFTDNALLYALVYGEGFFTAEWNGNLGDDAEFDISQMKQMKTGDLEFHSFQPFEVVRNIAENSHRDCSWHITRRFINRHKLKARYPQYAKEIDNLPNKSSINYLQSFMYMNLMTMNYMDDDLVTLFTFYHKKTENCPEGRIVLFCDSDVVLSSTPMPYKHYPVVRIAAGDLWNTPVGYTSNFCLLQLQEELNTLYRTTVTNMEAGASNNLWVPIDSNMSKPMLWGGMNIIYYNPGDNGQNLPKIIELCKTPPEVFEMMNRIVKDMETLSGVSAISRGQIPTAGMSGSAMAFNNSMSLQFLNTAQKNYIFAYEHLCNLVISILQDFAEAPRNAAIAGKDNAAYIKEFSKKDIQRIDRVECQSSNPLAKTYAGKEAIAQQIIQSGGNVKQLMEFWDTGNIENLYEGQSNNLLLIKSENEDMLAGIKPPVSVLDNDVLHIEEHSYVSSNPDVRKNPQLMAIVNQHILEHIQSAAQKQPLLAQCIGQPVIGQTVNQPQPNPAQQLPHKTPIHPTNPNNPIGPGNIVQGEASKVHQPHMPHPPRGTDQNTQAAIQNNSQNLQP